jgi:Na+/glutamate symporter
MEDKNSNKRLLLQYAGLGFQLLVSIGLAIYAGKWLDEWINTSVPVFLWLLPLAVIIAMIIKAIKDTSKK